MSPMDDPEIPVKCLDFGQGYCSEMWPSAGGCTAVLDTSSLSTLLSTLAAWPCCQGAQEDAWAGIVRTGLTHTRGTTDSASGWALGPLGGLATSSGEVSRKAQLMRR